MAYFNKKEEVLQIKLTQYGKHLLSKGKLKPVYYAFFDDDIIYDSSCAGFEERQNEAEARIQEETPSLKVQHIFSGAETNIKKLTTSANPLDYWEKDLPYPQHTEDHHYSFGASPLGTSTHGIQKAPSYLVNFLIGEMTGSSYYQTGSHQTLRIPQLDVDLYYETSFSYDKEDETTVSLRGPGGLELGGTFPDGSKINVKENHILIEISENNTEFSNKNFDIEVFLMEDTDALNFKTPGIDTESVNKKVDLKPLYFVKSVENIVDNILKDPDPSTRETNLDLDSSYVQHYFDLYADSEIDPSIICKAITADKVENMYDEMGFECSEKDTNGNLVDEEEMSTYAAEEQEC